ncbi:MAG: hypothetical protein HKO85_06720 [Xanthomonadales bacterium]|nr:hypothetical protein [Gammaproteobacteria bacterium]MBT8050940.1 hypothetical protein [Gammaproteobacteria bacterium]MBT8057286.1 hypothetical protein [Gammaproteobacteria bacterium]NNJ78650.1 hypothetical protein [Xanthomonadales bacterium]NNL04965.1 hypothetical protein [Xanthomonadales bacterium]
MKFRLIAIIVLALLVCVPAAADTRYRPFVLASVNETELSGQVANTRAALERAGYTIVGQYQPLESAVVIVATSEALKDVASASDRGAYAAALRIGVTERDGKTEVAYVNPLYLQHAYRLEADMQGVADDLAATLGAEESYGSEKGLTAKKLRKYNYMISMQKFDDPSELGGFDSFEAAASAVEQGLARPGDALSRVYRIDLPGEQALFGVAMKATGASEDEKDIDEAFQMSIVDFEGHSKIAYFPYEILVNGTQVEALHMRFRMAVHFPDLSMMGAHGFTKLMSSPGAIEDALEALVKSP